MAIDAFLVFTTQGNQLPLEGETQDKQFSAKNAIEISAYSLGIHNTTTVGSAAGGAGAGKAQFSDFQITKLVDKLSPTLLQYAGSGIHLQQLDLYLRKAGETGGKSPAGLVFMQFSFKLVYVTDIQWSGGSGDDRVKEDVTFAYGALQVHYTPQSSTGQQGTAVTGGWNRVTNSDNFTVPGIG